MMPETDFTQIKAHSNKPDWSQFCAALGLSAQGNSEAQLEVCGALVWVAFAAPEAIGPVYDVLSRAYLDPGAEVNLESLPSLEVPQEALPDSFWRAFSSALNGPEGGYDATSITSTVASLGGSLAPEFHQLVERAAVGHPGAVDAELKPIPALLQLEDIKACPSGSLGHALYRMLVDNGYDAEVLDREAIGLGQLKPAVRYLNTRILQMHDVWHLVAGYQTTSLHEIAISSFQLAQFGHNYSAMFLATVATMSRSNGPEAFNLMMKIFSESWVHGRQAPAFMSIEFESEWMRSIEDIRDEYGIEPFQGSFPANLFEQLKAAQQAQQAQQ